VQGKGQQSDRMEGVLGISGQEIEERVQEGYTPFRGGRDELLFGRR